VIRDNIDLGRPDRIQLLFDRRIIPKGRWSGPVCRFPRVFDKTTPGRRHARSVFRTRVIQDGVNPSLHIEYKNFDLKQYFKEGRGVRTEGTFRNLNDFDINKGLLNLPYAQKIGRNINRRLLEVERVSHNCGLSGDSIQRVVQPTVTEDGQKAPGLKFGTPRVTALFVALTMFQHLIHGFRNRDLRRQVAALVGVGPDGYTASQMTYDLRRLLRKGFIYRAAGTNRYFLTPYGWKVARLFSRLEARVFRPAMAAFGNETTGLPPPLLATLRQMDAEIDALIVQAVPLKKAS